MQQIAHRVYASLFFVLFGLTTALASAGKLPPIYVKQDVTIRTADGLVTLHAGTRVTVEVPQNFSAKNLSVGQTIPMRVKFNVVAEKEVAIEAGAVGSAVISKIEKSKGWGKGGTMEILVQSAQAVDQQQILLSGIPFTREGEEKRGLAIGLAIGLGVLTLWALGAGALIGFAIKGKPAELKAGTIIDSGVASEVVIKTK